MSDTICAISTSLGVGAVSMIRVSGKEAISIVSKLFNGDDLNNVDTHTIHYGFIVDNNEKIDEVLVTVMKAPKTFTREDVVEINCHGGIATTNKVLELLLLNGCRQAEPGEFTKRAFLNGRIDLMEAEAVADLINGKTEEARRVAISQMQGSGSKLISKLREDLVGLISNIEVNIDYPEYQDIYEVTVKDIKDKINYFHDSLTNIINNYENGRILTDGIKTVIVGRPNVGKSSILNKLLDYNKAIVTDIPGTTRDIVEGSISFNGILLNIIDTAGIRDTDNVVEKIGVEKSLNLIDTADLVIVVLNNNEELSDDDRKILDATKDKKRIIFVNKVDLESKLKLDLDVVKGNTIEVNGLDALKDKIRELFNLDGIEKRDLNYLSNAREISTIKEVLGIVSDIENALDNGIEVDMIEIDIKRIWELLGSLIGVSYDNELIDNIFSRFCLGK